MLRQIAWIVEWRDPQARLRLRASAGSAGQENVDTLGIQFGSGSGSHVKKFILLLLLSTSVAAAPIGEYRGQGLQSIPGRSSQVSAVMLRDDGNTCIVANGGGKMLCRENILDASETPSIDLGHMNGCTDIEGVVQLDTRSNLLADEDKQALLWIVEHGWRKCDKNAEGAQVEPVILSGLNESFGIEGISRFPGTRNFVVVKESAPAAVRTFAFVSGVTTYTPTDLFIPRDCDGIGDVAVRANGNVLLLCKNQGTVQEYGTHANGSWSVVSTLDISHFRQPEGIVEYPDLRILIVGEPSEAEFFAADSATNNGENGVSTD